MMVLSRRNPHEWALPAVTARNETLGRVRSAVVIPSPAGDGAICTQAAGMDRTGGDSLERTLGRVNRPCGDIKIFVSSPAGNGAICTQPARMIVAGDDSLERTFRCRGLPEPVGPPAGDGVVCAQPARMFQTGGDRREQIAWGLGFTKPVATPAGDGSVCVQPAGMGRSSGDGLERTHRERWSGRSGPNPSR